MRDMDDVNTLLSIAEKTLKWPKLKAIHEQAMKALEDHAASLSKPEPKEEPAHGEIDTE